MNFGEAIEASRYRIDRYRMVSISNRFISGRLECVASSIMSFFSWLFGKKSEPSLIKVNEKCWITPNGIIDLDPPLTPEQESHNRIVDFEIAEAERENKYRKECNDRKIQQWEESRAKALKENPDQWIPMSCPNIDMRAPKRIIAIRYVR